MAGISQLGAGDLWLRHLQQLFPEARKHVVSNRDGLGRCISHHREMIMRLKPGSKALSVGLRGTCCPWHRPVVATTAPAHQYCQPLASFQFFWKKPLL